MRHPISHATWSARVTRSLAPLTVVLTLVATGSAAALAQSDAPPDPADSVSIELPPAPLREGRLTPGTYVTMPFAAPYGWGVCLDPPQDGCSESVADDAISFTFAVPEGWAGAPLGTIWLAAEHNSAPAGAGLGFGQGGGLYSDPCAAPPPPDIVVGPSVDDFATALADHPLLDVTAPIEVTLGGYSGKYLELRVPSDISACPQGYYAWEPGLYAQGPDQRSHLWVLDVDGVRVVVQAMDYPGTSPEHQAQLAAIVDSIHIEPRPPLAAPASPRPAIGQIADDGARIVQVDTIDARTRDLTIESPSVGTVQVRLLLPAAFEAEGTADWPVLYLLHGYGQWFSAWTDLTDVEALTAPTDLLVVMPEADSGWYTDAWNEGKGGPRPGRHSTPLSCSNCSSAIGRPARSGSWPASRWAGSAPSPTRLVTPACSRPPPPTVGSWTHEHRTRTPEELDVGRPGRAGGHLAGTRSMSLAPALAGLPLYVSYGSGGAGPLDEGPVDPNDIEGQIGIENDAFVAYLAELDIPATVDAYGPGTHNWPYWERALHESLPMLLRALGESTPALSPGG